MSSRKISQNDQTRVNWSDVLADRHTEGWYKKFAAGESARSLERAFRNTTSAGPFRRLLRSKGVDATRTLVRSVLSRRQKSTNSKTTG